MKQKNPLLTDPHNLNTLVLPFRDRIKCLFTGWCHNLDELITWEWEQGQIDNEEENRAIRREYDVKYRARKKAEAEADKAQAQRFPDGPPPAVPEPAHDPDVSDADAAADFDVTGTKVGNERRAMTHEQIEAFTKDLNDVMKQAIDFKPGPSISEELDSSLNPPDETISGPDTDPGG